MLVSQPSVENPLSQEAEFGHIEKRCKAIIGNESGLGEVSIKFHQLNGSSKPYPNGKSNGGSFSLYCRNCKHKARDCSRSNPRFFPIVTAIFTTFAKAPFFKGAAKKLFK